MRRTVLVVMTVLLLAGCPAAPREDLKPNAVDRARVARVADDRWAAPTSTTLPRQAYGSNGLVAREAGTRESTRPGEDSRPLVRSEVDGALAAGWSLVSAVCDEDGQVDSVQVARGKSLDDSVRAVITSSPGGTREAPSWRVTVRLYVPHHADERWPRPREVQADATCLADPDAPPVEVEDVATGPVFPSGAS